MVGNVLEFAEALSRPHFAGKERKDILEEQNVAKWRYRQLLKWIAQTFVLDFDGCHVNPTYLAMLSMVRFGAALCAYMARWKGRTSIKGCTLVKFRLTVQTHLRRHWPELMPKFNELEKDPPSSFAWYGPDFQILKRENLPNMVDPEMAQHQSDPIFTFDDDEDLDDSKLSESSALTDIESSSSSDTDKDADMEVEQSVMVDPSTTVDPLASVGPQVTVAPAEQISVGGVKTRAKRRAMDEGESYFDIW
jgi:hypothetical protein